MFCKPSYVIHTQSPNFHHVQAIKCRLWLLQILIVDYDPAINPQVLPHLTGCGTHGPCLTFWKRSFHFLSVSVSWWHYNPLRRLGLDPWNLGIWESLAGGDWFDPNSTPAPPRISLEPGSWLLKRAAGREVFFHRVPTVHIDCWAGTAAAVEFPEDGAVPRQRLFCWWVMWFFPWCSWHCHLNLEGWKSLVKSRNKVLVRNWIYSLIWQWWWIRRKPLVLPSTNHFRNCLGSHRQPLLSNLTVEGRCYAALGRGCTLLPVLVNSTWVPGNYELWYLLSISCGISGWFPRTGVARVVLRGRSFVWRRGDLATKEGGAVWAGALCWGAVPEEDGDGERNGHNGIIMGLYTGT